MTYFVIFSLLLGSFCDFSSAQATNPLTQAHADLHLIFLRHSMALSAIRSYIGFFTQLTVDDMMEKTTRDIESWEDNAEDFGEAFQYCIANTTSRLNTIHETIYGELEKVQEETQDLQTLVLQELMTFNILEDYEQFYYHMSSIGRTIDSRFNSEIYPHLSNVISDLEWASTNLPGDLERCIAEIQLQPLCLIRYPQCE